MTVTEPESLSTRRAGPPGPQGRVTVGYDDHRRVIIMGTKTDDSDDHAAHCPGPAATVTVTVTVAGGLRLCRAGPSLY